VTSTARGERQALAAALRLGRRATGLLGELVLEAEANSHRRGHQARRRAEFGDALQRLRDEPALASLIERLCPEAAIGCGLRRVLSSRVRDGVWSTWRLHDRDAGRDVQPAWVEETAFALDRLPLEAAVVANAAAATVAGARSDARVHQPLRRLLQTESFVVAPIVVRGRVVGLLHGDRRGEARAVDEDDGELLWAFAQSAGRIIERTDLRDRLQAQCRLIRDTAIAAETLGEAGRPEIDLRQLVGRTAPATGTDEDIVPSVQRRILEEPLTARERDVLVLIAHGRDNAAIAERLAITRGTAKSHVRSIMRKLGAVNRTEIISRYHAS
jgi:DNA-binding CsgD family transcriptional regulator